MLTRFPNGILTAPETATNIAGNTGSAEMGVGGYVAHSEPSTVAVLASLYAHRPVIEQGAAVLSAGLYIEEQDAGATDDYAIYSAATQPSYFAGPITFAGGINLDPALDMAVLFANASGIITGDPTQFIWDYNTGNLGIGFLAGSPPAPKESLNVNGGVRIDRFALHAINLYFGDTATNSDGALVQYADSNVVGAPDGALLFGLGFTNAVAGIGVDALLVNNGSRLGFTSGNIQASLATATALWGFSGVPSDLVGSDGEWAISDNNKLYYKDAGAWTEYGGGGGGGMAIGDPVTGGTDGSVLFVSGGNLTQDNANLFWDDATNRLRIGPDSSLFGTATGNIGFGAAAGDSLTLGDQNVLFGTNAGTAITGGSENIAIGSGAAQTLTEASLNIAIGNGLNGYTDQCEYAIAIGFGNYTSTDALGDGYSICIGSESMLGTKNGEYANIAIGNYVMNGSVAGISGTYNIAMGEGALEQLESGDSNICIGDYAGNGINGTSSFNIAIGSLAFVQGNNTTPGDYNIAIGAGALGGQNGGSYNTAVGADAMTNSDNCDNNSAFGRSALDHVTTGDANVGMGYRAGNALVSGTNNTMLGTDSDGVFDQSNQTSVGFNAVCTAADQVTLGDANVTAIRAAVTSITAISDARDKKNINVLPLGLDFVEGLKPVQFEWAPREAGPKGLDLGFIAQDLDALQNRYGVADYLKLVNHANPDRLEATPGRLLPIVVRACQELAARVRTLEAKP